MKKERIAELLESETKPIYQIETELGIPKTTLQKAIKGERELPKKWSIKLEEKYGNQNKTEKILQKIEPVIPYAEVVETEIKAPRLDFQEILKLAKTGTDLQTLESLIKRNGKLTPNQISMIRDRANANK